MSDAVRLGWVSEEIGYFIDMGLPWEKIINRSSSERLQSRSVSLISFEERPYGGLLSLDFSLEGRVES